MIQPNSLGLALPGYLTAVSFGLCKTLLLVKKKIPDQRTNRIKSSLYRWNFEAYKENTTSPAPMYWIKTNRISHFYSKIHGNSETTYTLS